MNPEMKVTMLQNIYAAALAESINTYEKLGAHATVVESKKLHQPASAPRMNQMIGAQTAKDVFTNLSGLFGCANWQVEETPNKLTATATACKLCALSKQMGGANPCNGWCLDPMRAMIQALESPGVASDTFTILETLYTGDKCRVTIDKL